MHFKVNHKLSKDSNFFSIIKDIVTPPICAVCGKVYEDFLCRECKSKIPEIDTIICDYCGKPLICYYNKNFNGHDHRCEKEKFCSICRKENFKFYRHRSFAFYKGKLKKIIQKYKYFKFYELKIILAGFLNQAYKKYYRHEKIDYIYSVPDFKQSENTGDKNHIKLLCNLLSGVTGIPFIDNLIKIRMTQKQQKLNLNQRKNNLRGAFKVKDTLKVYGKNIMVVDDVWTTGATLNEISRILKNSNADKIYLLTIARG